MEVFKMSVTGQIMYTREFKRLVVEKKRDENWSWIQIVQWIEAEYGIKIPYNTVSKWSIWCREEQKGRVGKSSSEGPNKTKNWRPEEDNILKECIEEGLEVSQIVDYMEDTPELNFRTYTKASIICRRRRLGLGKPHPGLAAGVQETIIKDCKKILQKYPYSLAEYINALAIKVQCDSCNCVWKVERESLERTSCPKCSNRFVGGKPTGPQPALVYLLGFLEWGKCKIGYVEIKNSLSPEEAIHKTSERRKYPYAYTILAYDLSTKTDAGKHEDTLLRNTYESRAFIEKQEFGGWTEFRKIEVVKQILPQFKTVLDTALKI